MTYSDIQTEFLARLNRRDCTATLGKYFIQDGIKRIQRELRVPAMEKGIVATIGNIFSGGLDVPGDLIQLITITSEDAAEELDRRDLETVLKRQKYEAQGYAQIFCRRGSQYLLAPLCNQGDVIRIDYYAAFAPLVADTDTNVLTDIADDLIILAALVEGCTHFSDKRKDSFESDYTARRDELNEQATKDELTGNAKVATAFNLALDPGI
jgi:hypothetical protein